MITRKQKVICRVLCLVVSIFLLASFFVVPVAALDEFSKLTVSNIFYSFGHDETGTSSTMRPFSNLRAIGVDTSIANLGYLNNKIADDLLLDPILIETGSKFMEYYYSDMLGQSRFKTYYFVYYVNQLFDDEVTRTISAGDTFYISTSALNIFPTSPFTQFRLTVRDWGYPYYFQYGEVVGYSEVFDVTFTEDDPTGPTLKDIKITFPNDVTSQWLCLCLEFVAPFDDLMIEDFYVSIGKLQFDVLFGSGVSPNYPIYPPAPGGDDIGSLDSQEQQLIQDSQAGLNAGVDVMQNTGDLITDLDASLNLIAFTGAFNQIMNHLVLIPGLNPLVSISLSLGLFASLFGLAGSIISAASRGSGQASREALRESRKK